MLDARESSSNIKNAPTTIKVLKIFYKGEVLYATTYTRTRDGKKWDAFIKGIGWKKYSKATEIDAGIPEDEIDLAIAVRRFGEQVAVALIERYYSYYTAEKLAQISGFFWNSTYEKGIQFPINGFWKFIRYDSRLAIMGFPCLDIVGTDDALKRAFKDEYPENMSMGDFITLKFGEETSKAYATLIGTV